MVQAYNNRMGRVISALYQGLMASKEMSTLYIKKKWEVGFEVQITDGDWYNYILYVKHSARPQALEHGGNSVGRTSPDIS